MRPHVSAQIELPTHSESNTTPAMYPTFPTVPQEAEAPHIDTPLDNVQPRSSNCTTKGQLPRHFEEFIVLPL